MIDGYIKLYRQLLESEIFASQIGLKIWIWCLLKANYKSKFVSIKTGRGKSTIEVERGSFVFGRHKAEEELNIDESTIYKWIKKIEKLEMISVKRNTHYSIITICKYDTYQSELEYDVTTKEQPSNNQVAAEEQPCNTNNKVNKVYNTYYDGEILSSQNDDNYIAVVKILFGDNNLCRPLNVVLSMRDQLSYEEFKRLYVYKQKYGVVFSEIFEQMENWDGLKKRKSVSLTFLTFMKRRYPEIKEK